MKRLVLVMALVVLAFTVRAPALTAAHPADAALVVQAGQDTATDTLTVEDDPPPPLAPLPQLVADLEAIAARIDEVEANLAAAPTENQAVFVF